VKKANLLQSGAPCPCRFCIFKQMTPIWFALCYRLQSWILPLWTQNSGDWEGAGWKLCLLERLKAAECNACFTLPFLQVSLTPPSHHGFPGKKTMPSSIWHIHTCADGLYFIESFMLKMTSKITESKSLLRLRKWWRELKNPMGRHSWGLRFPSLSLTFLVPITAGQARCLN